MNIKQIKKRIIENRLLFRFIYPIYHVFHVTSISLRGKIIYRINRVTYNQQNTRKNFVAKRKFDYPIYGDRFEQAGMLSQYFWQDLWAASLIAKKNPERHFDIGSRVDGFIGHLASFRDKITLIDVRPLSSGIPGVNFIQADATSLAGIDDGSIYSLSALCSLEHFGLGRYGDPVDPEACFKAFQSINRVVGVGGDVYIAVPIGKEHVEFDAHRIFYARTIVNSFPQMELLEFSCIGPGEYQIERNVPLDKYDKDISGGGRFGLFHFRKKVKDVY